MALEGKPADWIGKRVFGTLGPGTVRDVNGGWVNVRYDKGFALNHRTTRFLRQFSPVAEVPSPSTPKQTWPSDPRVVNAESWHRMSAEEQERYVQQHGLTIGCTTDIGDEIRYGWGIVDDNGFWQFPCDWHTPTPETGEES